MNLFKLYSKKENNNDLVSLNTIIQYDEEFLNKKVFEVVQNSESDFQYVCFKTKQLSDKKRLL